MTFWCVRSIPPCLPRSLSSKSSCWQSPSASPRTSGRTSAGWRPSGNKGSPCLCLNPFWKSTLSVSPGSWSPGSSNPWFTEDGTRAPAFPIYFADRLTALALRWDTACVLAHVCICASPVEPALHSAQEANFPEEFTAGSLTRFIWKDFFACQPCLDPLLPAVKTPAAPQLSARAGQLGHLMCSEQQFRDTNMIHFPWINPSALCPPPRPRSSKTWSSYTRLTKSFSHCRHSDQTTVSIALWPFFFPLVQHHWWTT